MAGHIAAPYVEMELDPQKTPRDCLPASLNPTLLQGVLRDRLGFNGLITTDATIMGGYCMAMPRREALPASVMAGCDMLVFSTDFEEDYSFLMTALEDGRLTQERLDEAVRRILALKARVCGRGTEAQEVPARRWRRECACKAVTLVKAIEPGALPISPRQYPLVRLIVQGRDTICDGSMTEIATAWLEPRQAMRWRFTTRMRTSFTACPGPVRPSDALSEQLRAGEQSDGSARRLVSKARAGHPSLSQRGNL